MIKEYFQKTLAVSNADTKENKDNNYRLFYRIWNYSSTKYKKPSKSLWAIEIEKRKLSYSLKVAAISWAAGFTLDFLSAPPPCVCTTRMITLQLSNACTCIHEAEILLSLQRSLQLRTFWKATYYCTARLGRWSWILLLWVLPSTSYRRVRPVHVHNTLVITDSKYYVYWYMYFSMYYVYVLFQV